VVISAPKEYLEQRTRERSRHTNSNGPKVGRNYQQRQYRNRKADLTRDKNFTEEALKKQLILSDKAKVAEAKEANKLKEEKKLLADLSKRRNDLDVTLMFLRK
jgi:choline kinase